MALGPLYCGRQRGDAVWEPNLELDPFSAIGEEWFLCHCPTLEALLDRNYIKNKIVVRMKTKNGNIPYTPLLEG